MDTETRVDEPRKDECEALNIVLLDRIREKGEIKVTRLGGPEQRYVRKEPGKVSAPRIPQAAAAQKRTEGGLEPEGVKRRLPSESRLLSAKSGGVRVVDLEKASREEAEGRKRKEQASSKSGEQKRLDNDLNNSIAEGSFSTASSSLVNSYSTPFALSLGASNSEIGLLNSVYNLASILSQLPGAWLTRRMTRKRIWFLCTALSRLFIIPIIFIGLFFSGTAEIWIFIMLMGMAYFFSTMRGPAWSSMMGDMVPQDMRGRYFGKRNMIIGAAGMAATLAAGWAVYFWGFPAIFAAAVMLSFVSMTFFARMREPEFRQERTYHYRMHFHPADLLYQIRTNRNFAIFTAYMAVMNFGVNIAAPFVAVYMLKDLDIGYGWFAILVTIGALVQIASMRYWGSRCDRYGNRNILIVSGILMSFVPLGYILSTNVWDLVLLKVYDGFVWGAFDLVIFNYLLSVSPAEKRPTFVANHNFVSGAGTVLGALVGAVLAHHFASSGFLMLYGLQAVFLLSLLLRLSSTVFLPKIASIETKMCVPVKYVFWETVAIGPAKGIEHAITQAFRYPYTEKIKGGLGLKEKKVKISFRPKAEPDGSIKKQKPKEPAGKEVKGKGVLDMQLLDKQRSPEGGEYMELGIERQSPKTAKIVVHSLQRFTETDKVVKSIRARNVVFVGLRTMKQTNMDDLKQSVAKINRACIDCSSSLSLVDEEWLIVTPQTAALT